MSFSSEDEDINNPIAAYKIQFQDAKFDQKFQPSKQAIENWKTLKKRLNEYL